MSRSRRTRRASAAAKTGKPPDSSHIATTSTKEPPTLGTKMGSSWTKYSSSEHKSVAQKGSDQTPPFTSSAAGPSSTTPKMRGSNLKGKQVEASPTPSSGRRWAKKMGELTSETAAKYLRKTKSSPVVPKSGPQQHMPGFIIERGSSSESLPLPDPETMRKPSREVLSQGDIDRLKERLSHRSLNHPPKLGSFGEEDAEEQPASAERTIQEKKSLSKAPEYLDLTPLMHEGRLRMDYSSSEDADSEMPESSPIRGLRKKRVSTCSRVKDNSVATQDKDENTVEQDEYHLMIRTDPSGKTTFPFVSKRSATQSARNSRIQNKNTPRPRSVTSSSSLSPSPKAPTENPLPAGPHSDKYPDSARTVPAKRMSAGRPPIPYRSSKRFASSPSHATRPHLNTKIAPPSPSVGPQGEMSTTSENSDTPTPGGKLSKGTKVAHITPRNAGAMSKIPRASPLSLAPTTAGNGTPDSSAKSPVYVNRRSSIPVPRRLIQTNANIPENTAENGSSAINEDKPGEECGIKDEEYTDDDGSDDIKLYQASEMSIVKIEGSDVEHSYGKGGDSSDQDNGYRVKRLSLSGRGPTLRISAFADRVIMGRGLEKGKTPMEKLKANNERRRSWNPKEFGSKESSISTPSIKSMLSPRPNSSIGSASKKDKFGDGIETESSLKKAKSVDLLSPASSLSSPGSGSQRLEMRKASKSSLFKSDHVTRKPSPLREGFGASTPASRKSPRTPTIKEETPQQTPLSRIATRSERTPAENRGVSTSKDGIKKDDSPSARRVAKLAENKNGTVTSPKGIAGKSKPPNTLSKEHPPRSSSRNKTTDHTLNAKSKLAHVKNASSVSNAPSTGNKPEAIEPAEFGMNNDPVPDVNRNSVAADSTKTRTSTAKNSLSRGMLSNFKGFFGKQKSGIPESSTSASLRPKLSSTLKSKASKETKATTSATGATLPSERSTRFRSGRGRPTISSPIRFPDLEFPGNGDVNALTRDILDSAQRETDSAVKLRLIRLGRILVEAINHSNDAEKSMIQAMQAAKQAEVYSTMTKQNVMQLGLAVQELRNRSSQVDLSYDPNNVI